MTAIQIIIWVLLSLAAGITALLLAGHWSLAPFTNPGARANEASIIFLMLMMLRWVIVLIAIILLAVLLNLRGKLSGGGATGAGIAAGALHLGAGLATMWIWNYWVSVMYDKSPAQLWMCVAGYFGIPIIALATIAAVTLWSR
jgi:hypothetical protein